MDALNQFNVRSNYGGGDNVNTLPFGWVDPPSLGCIADVNECIAEEEVE